MDKSAFQEALRQFPAVSQNLVRILSARARLANELIQALAAMDVNGRVSASRKRVNQVMVSFREQEWVSLNALGRIIVLNRAGLMKYCG